MTALRPLRDHQQRAISGLRQSLLSGRKRPMLQMPTDAGKTLTSAHIVAVALGKGKRVAFCVPRKTLVDQTFREFEREGISAIGVMQAAHLRTDGRQPIQICSAQTLARRERPDVDLVIVDEAHEMHRSILTWIADCPSIPFIGLSATPWQRGMGKHYDDLLIPTTTRELIEAGFLSDFVAYAPSDPDLSGVSTKRGDYDQDELADAMDTVEITADIIATWLERGENRPTIAFCVNRRHAAHVYERFSEAGVAAEYLDGQTPSGDDSEEPDLPVTFDNFADYGVHRAAIGPALAELEALGFIVITEKGKMARAADYRRPNKFLLTSRPASKGADPLNKWRRFKTMKEAEAAAEAARNRSGEKKKSPVRETYQQPVLKPYYSDQIAGAETVPLRMSETIPLSISRVGTPPLSGGNGAGPSRLTPTGSRPTTPSLATPLVDDAPTPADALPSRSPTGRSAGPKLVWRTPVIRELAGAEAILRRNEINAADRNAQVADPMRLATIH